MLFLHHPMIWDIRQRPIFQNMDTQLLANFKKNNISIYALHVPLDNFGKYSTSATLADQLYITEKTAFGEYFGGLTGVIGTPKVKTIGELKDIFEHAVGHKV
ncbi:MAG: Nif3-like dinuclear metal center hexameric protein [bacterium]